MENVTTIALSRMIAQQRALDVTATNIANASTPGYHGERMVFADWLVREPAGAEPSGGAMLTYTQDRATYRDTRSGPLTHTANPLDLALTGEGYFTVQTKAGPRLTRAGHFELSSTGQVVDSAGNALLDTTGRPLQVATADTALSVSGDGTLASENGRIGRIGVVVPDDPQRLRAEGNRNFLAQTPTKPITTPGIVQGAVEDSNIQPTVELTRMMNDLREFQFTSMLVQSEADRQQGAIDKLTQKPN